MTWAHSPLPYWHNRPIFQINHVSCIQQNFLICFNFTFCFYLHNLYSSLVTLVQNSKEKNPDLMCKRDCPSLSGCHMAVSWSWASYHTSSERGHSGLSTDIRIWPIIQLIGILCMCFWVWQTSGRSQNMVIKYLSVGHMSKFLYYQIALDVLFQMRYDSLPKSNR